MDSDQYEELCRLFIAEKVGLSVDDVKSVTIPNAQRSNLPTYAHQIDLYWETGDEIAQYLNIANAKWRASDKVDQPDVMLLAKVREKVAAHKAFMISSVGFTSGAVATAQDEGIALHVVRPAIDTSSLPRGDRGAIREALRQVESSGSRPLYSHTVECRGMDFAESPAPTPSRQPRPMVAPPRTETRVAPTRTTRVAGGAETRGGPSPRTTGPGGSTERRG
ncbi:hypothetical protein [Candidatus Cryosericum septentrionale]|uniref:Restriction endonuclease type IV Mrr domain-containing protein n=1 Tax=Candidatus Cryosericum septentrionale TaxID=2290913 RepID=A0A398DL63_9BACT|nr:hypothetical protein [Candidatus Cryosericum septentrionale]RIE15885.1 hypothetical protein SMC1_09325 [Candidatus Cryosericum septentrionale]